MLRTIDVAMRKVADKGFHKTPQSVCTNKSSNLVRIHLHNWGTVILNDFCSDTSAHANDVLEATKIPLTKEYPSIPMHRYPRTTRSETL